MYKSHDPNTCNFKQVIELEKVTHLHLIIGTFPFRRYNLELPFLLQGFNNTPGFCGKYCLPNYNI